MIWVMLVMSCCALTLTASRVIACVSQLAIQVVGLVTIPAPLPHQRPTHHPPPNRHRRLIHLLVQQAMPTRFAFLNRQRGDQLSLTSHTSRPSASLPTLMNSSTPRRRTLPKDRTIRICLSHSTINLQPAPQAARAIQITIRTFATAITSRCIPCSERSSAMRFMETISYANALLLRFTRSWLSPAPAKLIGRAG